MLSGRREDYVDVRVHAEEDSRPGPSSGEGESLPIVDDEGGNFVCSYEDG